ncbi:tRNA glutamyl-Q(34) synthetase GluQRS [Pseudomarimonas salicorniae]|uniref:Glutamyl-Q tRNA(Asp) synthetase n=1 Tax=Pseudomarimonas salicorniae TaxID=2933270 RepID=A0ABT0GGZ5_9GAMM|nr:tRNA glutamyl-Q(34) synthetase GluQRS [Lysobacter sp. CAU 1642]MCK7593809.1 tRNA glutamyl-Q(34) synthetase GluQRS [Lysobacter sp. CAU 1642]
MSDAAYRGRFAPTPSGPLHFGSLVAAWASWLEARRHSGAWLVRIEDLDPPREVPGAAEAQLRTLARYGLLADEPVVRQSTRHGAYRAAVEALLDAGLAFHCSCSRRQLAASAGIHRRCLVPVDPNRFAIRLRVADAEVCFDDRLYGRCCEAVGRDCGDFVLLRADGLYAYQLAVVVDDAWQGITDVVRGADLLWSTPRQRLLQRALGLPHPTTLHLPLVLDPQGRKLSKSDGAADIEREDPCSVLRAAWAHLAQPADRLSGCRSVSELHVAAQQHWDCTRIQPAALPEATRNVIDAV